MQFNFLIVEYFSDGIFYVGHVKKQTDKFNNF